MPLPNCYLISVFLHICSVNKRFMQNHSLVVQIVHAIPYELFVPAMDIIEIDIQDLPLSVETTLIK